jgi:hypothetical protein
MPLRDLCVYACARVCFKRQTCNTNTAGSLLEIRVNAGLCSNLKGDIKAADNNIILVLVQNSYRTWREVGEVVSIWI